jgi:DNA (cytosine-5)-methyltransferase 1
VTLTAVSLFSGIGGLDLAAERAGFTVTDAYERDAFCCRVLRARFPHTRVHEMDIDDVYTLPTADVVFGGPPCQPHSVAGARGGAADPRHKWPAMLRLVRQSGPRCVLVENVRGGISSGLLDEIGGDLESAGYQVIPLVYPAQFVGAPHLRYRLFLLAYRQRVGQSSAEALRHAAPDAERDTAPSQPGGRAVSHAAQSGGAVGDDGGAGREKQQPSRVACDAGHLAGKCAPFRQRRLPQPGLVRAAHGLSAGLDFPGFPAYFGQAQHAYEPPRTVVHPGEHHRPRIQALGNAVVPQHAAPLFIALARWLSATIKPLHERRLL